MWRQQCLRHFLYQCCLSKLDQLLVIAHPPVPSTQCLMVVTRDQDLRQTEYSTSRESEQQCGVQPSPVFPEEEEEPFVGSEFENELFLSI